MPLKTVLWGSAEIVSLLTPSGKPSMDSSTGVDQPYRDRVDDHPGTPDDPAAYDMRPSFFAGEPIEDLEGKTNRLIIRLQSDGKRIEVPVLLAARTTKP